MIRERYELGWYHYPGQYGLTNLTQPASEPVTLANAKTHLRIDHTAEDTNITAWITAARQLTESYTNKRWVTQSLQMTLERFGLLARPIRFPISPVASVDSVTYTDASGNLGVVLASNQYQTWLDHNPPIIAPLPYQPWPIVQPGALQGVTIQFTAGVALANVPGEVSVAILLTLSDWDKNRAGEGDPIGRGLPPAARFILDQLGSGGYS